MLEKKSAIWLFLEFRNNFVFRKKCSEFVPWGSTHSMLLFHLHFQCQCNSVNRIFKLLTEVVVITWMKRKPLHMDFLVSLVSAKSLFSFYGRGKYFAHLFSLCIKRHNCKGSVYRQVKVKSPGFAICWAIGFWLYYLADIWCWASALPALSQQFLTCEVVVRIKWNNAGDVSTQSLTHG